MDGAVRLGRRLGLESSNCPFGRTASLFGTVNATVWSRVADDGRVPSSFSRDSEFCVASVRVWFPDRRIDDSVGNGSIDGFGGLE